MSLTFVYYLQGKSGAFKNLPLLAANHQSRKDYFLRRESDRPRPTTITAVIAVGHPCHCWNDIEDTGKDLDFVESRP